MNLQISYADGWCSASGPMCQMALKASRVARVELVSLKLKSSQGYIFAQMWTHFGCINLILNWIWNLKLKLKVEMKLYDYPLSDSYGKSFAIFSVLFELIL